MKKKYLILIAILVSVSINSGCQSKNTAESQSKDTAKSKNIVQSQKLKYKNGIYEAKTDADGEGFHSEAKVIINNNKITDVQWKIVDENGRVFDNTYGEVYPDNKTCQLQCKSDYKGSITYGSKLIKTQNIGKVDAISGATWSYRKFKEVVSQAIEESEK